jgi:carbamoyltransferase
LKIIGISAFYHDSAAALIIDGKIIACAQEERFSRIKNDADFPQQALEFCLEEGSKYLGEKLNMEDIDYLVFYEKPILKFERIILTSLRYFPKTFWFFVKSMMTWFSDKLWIKGKLAKLSGVSPEKILFSKHHLSHACSSYFCTEFQDAAVLTIDGVGEWATTTIGHAQGNNIRMLEEIRFPNSIGLLYSTITAFLGFEVNEGEYKVMGMASYGKPIYIEKIKEIFKLNEDASFTNVEKFYAYLYDPAKSYTKELEKLFGKPRERGDRFFVDPEARDRDQHYADIAKSLQLITEEAVLKLAKRAKEITGSQNLCLAGGVALNCVANERILRELDFQNVFIQPAAGDAGGALGAAFYAYNIYLNNPKIDSGFSHPYWGSEIDDAEIEAEIKTRGITNYKKFENFDDLLKELAAILSQEKVIGWCQGRFEWGPRSLGARSIIASASKASMRDTVNLKIKFREAFRPFAPAVIEQKAEEYFDLNHSTQTSAYKYMLATCQVKQADKLEAITHVDGSGRVQTVNPETNEKFYNLLKEYENITGIPVLINTSFNLRGEPIVTTCNNALNTFFKSGLDVLAVNNYLIWKSES